MDGNVDAWVRQYVSWAEQQIAGVIVKEQLHVQLVRVVRGPLTITFQVALLPQSLDKGSLAKLKKLDGIIGLACRTGNVRVDEGENGLINIELPMPKNACATPPADALAKLTQGPNLCMGIDSLRNPVNMDLRQHGAVLWVGPSRSGKTQSIKSTMYTLLAQARLDMRFMVIAQKVEDWEDMAGLRQSWGIAHTVEEMQAAVTWVGDELTRRTASKVKRPLIVVIADDMINLIEADATFGKAFGAIASQGAGLGINLLIGTQEAGSKRGTGDNSVENNVTARVIYRISNTQAASRSAGQGGAGVEKLTGTKGDALFILHGITRRIATGFVGEGLFSGLPQGAEVAPWRESMAVADRNQRNQSQPATTTYNQPQPVATSGEGMWYKSEKGDTRNDVIHPYPPTPVATSPATTGATSVATTTAPTAVEEKQSAPSVPPVSFPIPRRPLTQPERAEVRKMIRDGMSKNKVQFTVYGGSRDGKTAAWVNEALAEGGQQPDREESKPVAAAGPAKDAKDMDDQELLAVLLEKKMINWGETSKLNQGIMAGGARA